MITTKPDDPREASLVALAQAGDGPAIDQLVGRYWSIAYRVAAQIVRSHEDAEDVAQDAIWAAITHISSFRQDACFRTWLHRITVNHSLMALRRKHSKTPGSLVPLTIDPPGCTHGSPTPEQLLLENEYRTVVEEALSRVPHCYSVALRLASRENRSTHEIAEYMGISVAAVKTRLHRGRAYLRREVLERLRVKNAGMPESVKGVQQCRLGRESNLAA
jgi:RNA polymerase sigma-70 factor, ECF subfamily